MVRSLSLLLVLSWPTPAEATYSIAAVDTASMEVGGAGTSCVGNFSVSVIYGSMPGVGVVHAQAYFNEQARDRAVELLGAGSTPQHIIDEITSQGFDPFSANRQYGVVTIDGASAAFTGTGCDPWAGHDTGLTVDRRGYSAQGNILTSENVVLNTSAAFEAGGCDLAERLMLALEAGAMNGEGDSRCTPDGIPSDGAFIRVDRANDPGWLDLRIDNVAPMNPLVMLRMEFDQWRMSHPCTVQPPVDAGVPDSEMADADDADGGQEATADADASANAKPNQDASQVADTESDEEENEGCGCSALRSGDRGTMRDGLVVLVLFLLGMGSPRRLPHLAPDAPARPRIDKAGEGRHRLSAFVHQKGCDLFRSVDHFLPRFPPSSWCKNRPESRPGARKIKKPEGRRWTPSGLRWSIPGRLR